MSRIDAIRQKKQEANQRRARSFTYVDTVKAERLGIPQYKTGVDNFIYIIPPVDINSYYGKEIWVHRNVGADGLTFLCPHRMQNKYCPICADIKKLKAKDPQDEAIQDLRPSARFLFFVVDVKSPETEKKGPQWYDAPVSVNDAIVKISEDKRTGRVVDVSDPARGYNIVFGKSGSKKMTRYESFVLEPRESPAKKDWLDVPEFDEILNYVEADVIEAAYLGMPTGGASQEGEEHGSRRGAATQEEEEAPRRRRTEEPEDEAPRGRRAAAEEPAEEAPRRRAAEEPVDDDRSERLRGRREVPAENEEQEAPPRRRATAEPEPEREAPPRRRAEAAEEPEPAEEAPRRRAAAADEPEDNDIHNRVRQRVAETHAEDEQEPPRRRRT